MTRTCFPLKRFLPSLALVLTMTHASAERFAFETSEPKFLGNVLGNDSIHMDMAENFIPYWDQLTPENAGKWGVAEREPGQFNWEPLDVMYATSRKYGIPFKQHTFCWGMQAPKWIDELPADAQRAAFENWMRAFMKRYPDTEMIDVVNEPITIPADQYKEALGGDGETGWDWVITAFELARETAPEAMLILNEHSILTNDNKLERFLEIVHLLQERDLIDCIGLQAHFTEHTHHANMLRRLNRVAATGLPIVISEFDLDIGDDEFQLQRMQELFPIIWEHPSVRGVTLWGWRQGQLWRKKAFLIREDGTERPAFGWLMRYTGRR